MNNQKREDARYAFFPSPKLVFNPALEWWEGHMDETVILDKVIAAMDAAQKEAEHYEPANPVEIDVLAWRYLCYLHGHHEDEIRGTYNVCSAEGRQALNEALYANRMATISMPTFEIYGHSRILNLCDGDLVVPMHRGYLIRRSPRSNHRYCGEHVRAFYLILNPEGPLNA